MSKVGRFFAASALAFGSLIWATPTQASEAVVCDTHQVNGGDQAFLMTLNTPLEFGGTIYDGNIYVSPKGTVTFGQGDFTFWDYPATPSISIGSFDYHAFANGVMWGAENDLYVRYGSTATSICVDWKVMLWGQSSGDPIYIRMIAYVNPENYTWTPEFQVSSNAPSNARYGVRYEQGGEVFPLTIQTITEPPVENPVVVEPEPTPEPETESPTVSPEPLFLNSPTNLRATQLSEYNVELLWDSPSESNAVVERYAIMWSTDNFESGWGVASTETNIYLSQQLFESTGGLDTLYQFRVRSDNDTESVYSQYSDPVEIFVASPSIETESPTVSPDPEPSESPSISPEPSPEPTPEPSPQPEPSPSPSEPITPAPTQPTQPEPEPIPSPTPAPVEPEVVPPIEEPQPQPEIIDDPEPVVTPLPQPETIAPEPEVEITPEEPSLSSPNLEPEPSVEEPVTPVEPISEPVMPISIPEVPSLDELLNEEEISVEQAEVLQEMAFEILETAEKGSEEYEAALEALALAATADDIVIDEELAAIPVIGVLAEGIVDIINFAGNVGADMAPETRERAEETVVAAVIVGQVAQVASLASISGGAYRRIT